MAVGREPWRGEFVEAKLPGMPGGGDVPETWTTTDIQQWVTTFDPAVQEFANEILRLLQTSKVTTQQLKEAATRYGLPLGRVNRLPIRSLQHLVSVGAAIGC